MPKARPQARHIRRILRALRGVAPALALAVCVLLGSAAPALAQRSTLYFVTLKRGITDASNSGESFARDLEGVHGSLLTERAVDTSAVELDVYGISKGVAGLALGIEVLRYENRWYFADGEFAHMRAKGVLFTLKSFLRLGPLLPFVGVGIGNYYVNYDQPTGGISLRDSPDSAYTARVGLRVLLGRLGLLVEAGNTEADVTIATSAGRSTLELGGNYTNVGLSWTF